ncbi:acyclic terpene utilization AtuA family protein [Myxococcus xanthus]|uniref:acyclic terpene utilization AtuA family protein n=2 Tax=Myxococcus TaxID=32 RepID=UPI0011629A4A|nr:acyclic terpene utilization AtuA family protein [Myxococcus xanthus]QDE80136.1 exopolyphosphatase [Myxococcus xanthus]
MPASPLRVGNASGFYGDRFSAVREMLEGGQLDVLTGDYLAELTMLILGRDRMKDPSTGYAKTFLRQMEQCLALVAEKKVKVVTNAGGLNPAGLATALREVAAKLGVKVQVAHVEGDDLSGQADALGLGSPLTANAYLGGWGIAACLRAGADIVVTGRVTDASLVVGPAAAHFGWKVDDWDRLAGAMVAGHVLECGTQATGGNFSFFTELDARRPGFPLAELYEDGSSVITKHAGTGGAVTVDTVLAQLVYEITGARYAGPDATARFDTIALASHGKDRVRISGVRGEPPPPTVKVCLNNLGGYRNEATFILVGLDIEEKARLAREQLEAALTRKPKELQWMLTRTDREDAATEEQAAAFLRVVVKDADAKVVGRAFSGAAVELALGSYPGFTMTAPPSDGAPYGVYTPAYVEAGRVEHVAVLEDGTRTAITPPGETRALESVEPPPLPPRVPDGPTRRVPLGRIVAARSGDKGGTANIGVWARTDAAWRWLAHALTEEKLRELLPEAAPLRIERHVFPNLRGLNFVVDGLLGEGVSSSTRFDPQGKALGEWLRSRHMDIPEALLREGQE